MSKIKHSGILDFGERKIQFWEGVTFLHKIDDIWLEMQTKTWLMLAHAQPVLARAQSVPAWKVSFPFTNSSQNR